MQDGWHSAYSTNAFLFTAAAAATAASFASFSARLRLRSTTFAARLASSSASFSSGFSA
jgi:hypothetical protein